MGPTLAASTMSKNLWLPFWLNIALLLCAIPTIILLPNPTSPRHTTRNPTSGPVEEIEEAGPLLENTDTSPTRYSTAFKPPPTSYQTITQTLFRLRNLVLGRYNFQVLLVTFFFTALASSDTKLLVQYISKRYNWTFAQAGYLLSAKALVNLTLLVVVVPRLVRTSISAKAMRGDDVRLNMMGARVSIAVSVLGVLCIAVASRFWMLLTGTFSFAFP